jgi:hypothetical protein
MTFIPLFQIGLHKKDVQLLKDIKSYLGGIGSLSYSKDLVCLKVQSLKQILAVIIPHFDKYPLITQKLADYLLFRQIVLMLEKKEHLNNKGVQAIANIKARVTSLGSEVRAKEGGKVSLGRVPSFPPRPQRSKQPA